MKEIKELVNLTIKNLSNSYAPYSKFEVSAAYVLDNDEIVYGNNIENASYGLTVCAERTGLFHLHLSKIDKKRVKMLIIVGATNKPISPCGSCRQVLSEFFDASFKVVLANTNGDIIETTLGELLPYSFNLNSDKL